MEAGTGGGEVEQGTEKVELRAPAPAPPAPPLFLLIWRGAASKAEEEAIEKINLLGWSMSNDVVLTSIRLYPAR